MRIEDIMTTEVWSVASDVDADVAWDQLYQARLHHLVVVDHERAIGILSQSDLGAGSESHVRFGRKVGELMSRDFVSASPDLPLLKAAILMRGHGTGCLPIIRDDTLVGIVTLADLLELIGHGIERILPRKARRRVPIHIKRGD